MVEKRRCGWAGWKRAVLKRGCDAHQNIGGSGTTTAGGNKVNSDPRIDIHHQGNRMKTATAAPDQVDFLAGSFPPRYLFVTPGGGQVQPRTSSTTTTIR